jgi:hypothetical protein
MTKKGEAKLIIEKIEEKRKSFIESLQSKVPFSGPGMAIETIDPSKKPCNFVMDIQTKGKKKGRVLRRRI